MRFRDQAQLIRFLDRKTCPGKGRRTTKTNLGKLLRLLISSKNYQESKNGYYYNVLRLRVGRKSLAVKLFRRNYGEQIIPSKKDAFAKANFLLPIWRSKDRRVIVQPWAEHLSILDCAHNSRLTKQLGRFLKMMQDNAPAWLINDLHEENLAFYRGKVKIIDFGHKVRTIFWNF